MERICNKCNRPFRLTAEFFPSRKYQGRSIFLPLCRECAIARQRLWAKANPERVKEHDHRWRRENLERIKENRRLRTQANAERIKKQRHEYRKAHLEERRIWQRNWKTKNYDRRMYARKAHAAVRRAIQRGDIIRPSERNLCNITCIPEAHHHLGYEKEHHLDVVFLCEHCHKAAHPRSNAPSSAA